jgi:hypothetical protein
MNPLTLFIIRHAEKPGETFPGSGRNEADDTDDKSLVLRGWQRAGAWAALFGSGYGRDEYPIPTLIYAAKPGDRLNHGPSRRPSETVSPLAAKLRLEVNLKYEQGAEADLMRDVLKQSGNVLICWEHIAIISGILPTIPSVVGRLPSKWNGNRFDVVLRFDGSSPSGPFSFRELYPCLLAGDSTAPLG